MSLTVFNDANHGTDARPDVPAGRLRHAGVTQKGIPGGLLSGMLFQYPGLMMMALAGAGAAEILVDPADWLRGLTAGLSAAGVALVVSAAVGLARPVQGRGHERPVPDVRRRRVLLHLQLDLPAAHRDRRAHDARTRSATTTSRCRTRTR